MSGPVSGLRLASFGSLCWSPRQCLDPGPDKPRHYPRQYPRHCPDCLDCSWLCITVTFMAHIKSLLPPWEGTTFTSFWAPPLLSFNSFDSSTFPHSILQIFEGKERGTLDLHFHPNKSSIPTLSKLDLVTLGFVGNPRRLELPWEDPVCGFPSRSL
jgi:hypothetical protein